jgi:hypothetical protein
MAVGAAAFAIERLDVDVRHSDGSIQTTALSNAMVGCHGMVTSG